MAHYSLQSAWSWAVRHKANLFQFGGAFAAFESFNWLFDKAFFPVALLMWGPVWGAVIPTAFALAINTVVFWLYEHLKIDWLQAHAVRQLADKENKTTFERIVTFHRRPRTTLWERIKGEAQFVALLTYVDPVIVAIYYRQEYFTGLRRSDWLLLVKATIIACVNWLITLELLYFVWKFVVWAWHSSRLFF